MWIAPRRAEAKVALSRHFGTGELPPNTDLDLAVELLYAPLYYRLLTGFGEITPEYIDNVAQTVLRGADGRRVAAWATADDDKVKGALLSHAQSMPRRASHAGVSALAPSTFPDESTHFRHVIAPERVDHGGKLAVADDLQQRGQRRGLVVLARNDHLVLLVEQRHELELEGTRRGEDAEADVGRSAGHVRGDGQMRVLLALVARDGARFDAETAQLKVEQDASARPALTVDEPNVGTT